MHNNAFLVFNSIADSYPSINKYKVYLFTCVYIAVLLEIKIVVKIMH